MKFMTKLETIIMNRTGCNRETANLVANDILQEADKDISADIVLSIFADIDKIIADLQLDMHLAKRGFAGIISNEKSIEQRLTELKKKYESEVKSDEQE